MTMKLVHSSSRQVNVDMVSERVPGHVPPHDLDAEAAVLSAVMLDPSALSRIEDFLLAEHFFSEAHRQIYAAAVAVKGAGRPVDEQTIASDLKETKRLEQVGGMPYISRIMDSAPAVGNVRAYAETVHERWRIRQAMLLCERAATFGYGVVDAQEYLDSIVQKLSDVARRSPTSKIEENYEMLRRLVRQMREAAAANGQAGAQGRGIPTGISSLDDEILGLFAGTKTTIVAPPRVGKTALALQIAINVARSGFLVAFFSTEMTREELGIRQLSYLASIDSRRIQKAMQKSTLDADEWKRLTVALDAEKELKSAIQIFDDTNISVDEIAARSNALAESAMAQFGRPLGVIVVDYVQNLRPANGYENRKKYEQVGHSTTRLKNLAKELKLAVIELAQSKNIEVEKGKSARPHPQLGDAAESFTIERAANTAIHLWRPNERDGAHVKACVVKQRAGTEPDVDLRFHREYSRFEPLPFGPMTPTSRGYVDETPEPPPGRFDDEER